MMTTMRKTMMATMLATIIAATTTSTAMTATMALKAATLNHWDLSPESSACEADVIPLHHWRDETLYLTAINTIVRYPVLSATHASAS